MHIFRSLSCIVPLLALAVTQIAAAPVGSSGGKNTLERRTIHTDGLSLEKRAPDEWSGLSNGLLFRRDDSPAIQPRHQMNRRSVTSSDATRVEKRGVMPLEKRLFREWVKGKIRKVLNKATEWIRPNQATDGAGDPPAGSYAGGGEPNYSGY